MSDEAQATRQLEGGTPIEIVFGKKVIPGRLNDSKTAAALLEKLPVTIDVNNSGIDHCGIIEELPFDEDDVHYGWQNGDIDYATDGPWFTILFANEEKSGSYGYQVNIGVVDGPLDDVAELAGTHEVTIRKKADEV